MRRGAGLGFIESIDITIYFSSHKLTHQLTSFHQAAN